MPELVLVSRDLAAHTVKYGTTEVVMAAGKRLKIETSPAGEEILNVLCATGKRWVVRVDVQIIETAV